MMACSYVGICSCAVKQKKLSVRVVSDGYSVLFDLETGLLWCECWHVPRYCVCVCVSSVEGSQWHCVTHNTTPDTQILHPAMALIYRLR